MAGCGSDGDEQKISDVSGAEAVAIIKENAGNANFVILDVRTPQEYNSGYINGAVNIDYRAADFNDRIAALDKGKVYLVYCGSGMRSAAAVEIMRGLGFSEVYNVLGGLSAITAVNDPAVAIANCGCQ